MSFEQYRIEWIPNTPEAIREAEKRGGRVLYGRTRPGRGRTRLIEGADHWIDASSVADILSDAGLIAVAFGAVRQIAKQARGATKAVREFYDEARKLAETVRRKGSKKSKARRNRTNENERELESKSASNSKDDTNVGRDKKTIKKSKKRAAKAKRRSTAKPAR